MNSTPLAERIRPKSIEQFYGQTHLLGKNGVIKVLKSAKKIKESAL